MTSVRLPIVSEADRRLYWLPLAQTGLMGSMGLIFRNKSPSLLAGAEHLGGHGPGPGPWPIMEIQTIVWLGNNRCASLSST